MTRGIVHKDKKEYEEVKIEYDDSDKSVMHDREIDFRLAYFVVFEKSDWFRKLAFILILARAIHIVKQGKGLLLAVFSNNTK